MDRREQIHDLWRHLIWADGLLLEAIRASGGAAPDALREYAHVAGAEEVWLARLEQRPPRLPAWPDVPLAELQERLAEAHAGWKAYLSRLQDGELASAVAYTNSAGYTFATAVGDILLHVALHGQYHRGRVNLLLRQAGCVPAPVDYIAFVRGAPVAGLDARPGSVLP